MSIREQIGIEPQLRDIIYRIEESLPVHLDEYIGIQPELRIQLQRLIDGKEIDWSQFMGFSPSLRAQLEKISPATHELLAPTDLIATPGYDSVYLSWTNNSTNKTGTSVNMSLDGITYGNSPATPVDDYTWEGLDPDTAYWFKVNDYFAWPPEEEGPYSDPVETATLDYDMVPPTDITLIPDTDNVRIEWTQSIGVDGAEINYSLDGVIWEADDPGTTAEFYNWLGLDPDTDYWFRLRSYISIPSLKSEWSETYSTKTLPV